MTSTRSPRRRRSSWIARLKANRAADTVLPNRLCREVPIRRYAQALQHNAAGTLARSMGEHNVILRLAKRRVGLEHFDDPAYHRRDQLARPRVEPTGFMSSMFRIRG